MGHSWVATAGTVVASLKPNTHGVLRVSLPPGRYSVYLMSGTMADAGTGAAAVTVRPGQFARATLSIYGP